MPMKTDRPPSAAGPAPAGSWNNHSWSAGDVAQLFRDGRSHSRADLITATGLARSTVDDRLTRLCAAGVILEVGRQVSTGGRPASGYSLANDTKGVLAVVLDGNTARLALVSARGRILRTWQGANGPGSRQARFLREVSHAANALVRDEGWDRNDVWAVGVGTGAGWDTTQAREWAANSWPTHVENTAAAAAMAALRDRPGTTDLLYADVGADLRCTLILDRHVIRRTGGGNLSTVVDATAEMAQLASAQPALSSALDLDRLLGELAGFPDALEEGETALTPLAKRRALRVSRDAGRAVGLVLAPIISLLYLQDVVIGVSEAKRDEVLLGARESLMRCLPADILLTLSIEATSSDPLGGIAEMAIDLALSVGCLNALTAN